MQGPVAAARGAVQAAPWRAHKPSARAPACGAPPGPHRRRRRLPPRAAAGGVSTAPGGEAAAAADQQRHARLQGKYSYKMVKALPSEQLRSELVVRGLPTIGRKDQLASRVYSALFSEGRALSKEESAVVDAQLGLSDICSDPGAAAPSWDSGEEGSGGEEGGGVAAGEVASSQALQSNPLLALQASRAGRFLTDTNSEQLLSNAANLQLFFLWGGTAPNAVKHTTSCVVRTAKSVWLFECGEDAQRHLVRNQAIAWAKLERVFVSSLAADNILGLPGMLCTISAAREKGHEAADTPVHIYGPPGLTDFINAMVTVSRTYLEMPVVVHELVTAAVPEGELWELQLVNPRAKIYRTRLPPDQLNPEGYYDAGLQALLTRHTRKRTNTGIDLRAACLPLELPLRGDPTRTGLHVRELTWSIKADHEWLVQAAPLGGKQATFGFMLQEADRAGKLFVDEAEALGVVPGEDYSRLKNGESVTTPDGRTVQPWQCVGPPRRGRRVAVISSCRDSLPFAQAMSRSGGGGSSRSASSAPAATVCDLVVHAMSAPPAAPGGQPTSAAAMAGACAAALGGKELVLWQHQASFVESAAGADPEFPARVIAEARAALGSEYVSLAGCYWVHQPERDEHERPTGEPPRGADA